MGDDIQADAVWGDQGITEFYSPKMQYPCSVVAKKANILGTHTKELKVGTWTGICLPVVVFIASFFTIAKRWKQPKCSSEDEWKTKMWYIDMLEYYSVSEGNEIDT